MPLRAGEKVADAERIEFRVGDAGDEFAAHAVARLACGLDDPHRHAAGAQGDAEREACETAACDGEWKSHFRNARI